MTACALRLAVTAATGLSLLAAGGAVAAPKPVCNLVSDAAGDVMLPSAALDVVSADIATDAKKLTGVIRVAKLANSDGTAPTGFAYPLQGRRQPDAVLPARVQRPVADRPDHLRVRHDRAEPADAARRRQGRPRPRQERGARDGPTALGPVTVKPGTKIVDLQAITQRRFGVLLSAADSTVSDEKRT